jgi:hypothetical protein
MYYNLREEQWRLRRVHRKSFSKSQVVEMSEKKATSSQNMQKEKKKKKRNLLNRCRRERRLICTLNFVCEIVSNRTQIREPGKESKY